MARKIEKNLYQGTVKGTKIAKSLLTGGAQVAKGFGTLLSFAFSPMGKVRAISTLIKGVSSIARKDAKQNIIKKKAKDLLQEKSHKKDYTEFTAGKTNAIDKKVKELKLKNTAITRAKVKVARENRLALKELGTSAVGIGSVGLGVTSLMSPSLTASQNDLRKKQKNNVIIKKSKSSSGVTY